MNKLKIAVGSASRYKLNAIEKAIHELDVDFEVEFAGVGSDVSSQPSSIGETRQGSINRAENVLKEYPNSDIGLGVEFGYEPEEKNSKKIYRMVCWASIVTKNGKIFSEQSSTLQLPKRYKEALEKGVEVNDVLDDMIDKLPNTQSARKFASFIYKRRTIYECVENVMLRYLFREEY